eukprot:IDg19764t1
MGFGRTQKQAYLKKVRDTLNKLKGEKLNPNRNATDGDEIGEFFIKGDSEGVEVIDN